MAQTKAQLVDYGTAVASSVPTNGPYLSAANTVAISTNGVKQIEVDSSGNILKKYGTEFRSLTSGGSTSHMLSYGTWNGTSNLLVLGNTFDGVVFGTGGGTMTEKARIDSSGRLLVGTSSATANIRLNQKLAVVSTGENLYGGASLTSYSGTSAGARSVLDFQRSRGTTDGSYTIVANSDELGSIIWRGSDGSQFLDGANISAVVDGTPGANDLPTRLVFSTTADGASSPTERFRLNSNGQALFNGASFGGTINVAEYSSTQPVIAAFAAGGSFGNDIIYSYTNSSGTGFNFYRCNSLASTMFRVRGDGTIFAANTTVQSTSDIRLKENIRDYDCGLNQILALRPVRFDWKDGFNNGTKNHVGFVAQEVKSIIPEAVDVYEENENDPDDPYLSMGSGAFIPAMIKAIQEQQAMIIELQAKVAALKAQ